MKAYFVDTNYILRLLLKDNQAQFEKVYSLFQKAISEDIHLHTSLIVLFEVNWVLSSFYKNDKSESVSYIEKILQMDVLKFEEKDLFIRAINIYKKSSLSLEDSYNAVYFKAQKFDHFATFDQKLSKIVSGFN